MRSFLALSLLLFASSAATAQEPKPLRVGIIGLDTSHVVAFTKILNDPKNEGELANIKVVAAYPGGSPDIPASKDRLAGFTKKLRDDYKVEIVDSIEELLKKVDVVLLESVDGRKHLEQAGPVFKSGKAVFIDKPVAGSLADAIAIVEMARKTKTPFFSSSSLRFSDLFRDLRKDDTPVGKVLGAVTYGACSLEPHHLDLYWYGVHGVESLYAIMGPGCVSVVRTHTPDTDVVTGVWKDGRVGTFRGIRKGSANYGATIFGTKTILTGATSGGYEPLLKEIGKFFRTGVAPVSADETLEMFAFMEAADESKRQNGAPVTLESVLKKARGK